MIWRCIHKNCVNLKFIFYFLPLNNFSLKLFLDPNVAYVFVTSPSFPYKFSDVLFIGFDWTFNWSFWKFFSFKRYSSFPLIIVQPGCCFLVGCSGQGERDGNCGERGGWWSWNFMFGLTCSNHVIFSLCFLIFFSLYSILCFCLCLCFLFFVQFMPYI